MSEKKRLRVVYNEWVRDPKGKLLEKPPPTGKRTENNIIWGHTLDDFYWIPRIPGVNVLTIWSRSMIQEYGENYMKEKHIEEPAPRRLRPYPCLTLPSHIPSSSSLGYIDEGCGEHHREPLSRVKDELPNIVAPPRTKFIESRASVFVEPKIVASKLDDSPSPVPNANTTPASSSDTPATASPPTAESPAPINPASASQENVPVAAEGTASAAAKGTPFLTSRQPLPAVTTQLDTPSDAAPDACGTAPPAPNAPPPASANSAPAAATAESSSKPCGWTSDTSEWAAAKVALPPDVESEAAGDAPAQEPLTMDVDVDAKAVAMEGVTSGEGDGSQTQVLDVQAQIIDAPQAQVLDVSPVQVLDAPNAPVPEAPLQDRPADAAAVDSAPKLEDAVAGGNKTGGDPTVNEVKAPEKSCSDGVEVKVAPGAAGAAEDAEVAKVETKATVEPPPVATGDAATSKPVAEAEETSAPPAPIRASGVKAPPPTPKPVEPIFHNLPKLEEFIPEEFFPDILYVNDPDDLTQHTYYYHSPSKPPPQSQEPVPRKYKRVWPRFARDTEPATAFNTNFNCASIKVPPASTASPPPPMPTPAVGFPPVVPKPSTNLRIAHLNMSSAPCLGVGNHSSVHRAALRLPVPLSARSPTGEVTVAAKTGFSNGEARKLLHNEGKMYDAFPKHLQEDWCGLNLVAPITHPVPVGAVVPKFYGYYVPVREDVEREKQEAVRAEKKVQNESRLRAKKARAEERLKEKEAKRAKADEARKAAEAAKTAEGADKMNNDAAECKAEDSRLTAVPTDDKPAEVEEEVDDDEEEDDEDRDENEKRDEQIALQNFKRSPGYKAWDRLSPILLLQECGSPITPGNFSADERSECYSLALRLHHAEFTQNSFYTRNILKQAGPLTVEPSKRSMSTPSFRIIDFGRGEFWPYKLEAAKEENVDRRRRRTTKHSMAVPTEEQMKLRVAQGEREDTADKEALERCGKAWWELRDYEVRKAHSELQIQDFMY